MTERATPAPTRSVADAAPDGNELLSVRFDRKTWVVLSSFLLLVLLGTAFRLHGSSIAAWKSARSHTGVLLGNPKAVRVDEWGMITPAMLSQARQQPPFPEVNPSWGGAKSPLVMNLPVRRFCALFRPQYWGFFAFDLERAFSFYWNMKTFLLNTGVFLLLMLLTRNDLWVSLLGTGWVFFSGYTQWWYSTPAMLPEMVGCFALSVVAAHTLAVSARREMVVAAAVVLAGSSINFALCLYPPFQLTLAYLGAALLIGTLWSRLSKHPLEEAAAFRVLCAASAALLIGLVLASYARDAKGTIDLVRNTVYPGARTSLGGDVSLAWIFGGSYGFFMSEDRYPKGWNNVCEASNFLLLFPLPLAYQVWHALRRERIRPLVWFLLAYIGMLLVWMAVGWPQPLAALSGFSLVPGIRAALGLGLASILWCCIFLSGRPNAACTMKQKILWAGSFALLSLLFGAYFNRSSAGFLGLHEILLVCALVGATCFCLLGGHRIGFAASVLVPNCLSFGLVNPIAVGLGPITDSDLYREISRIVVEDPQARWIVYGDVLTADLVKATGARVFNGTLFVPPLEDLRILDPQLSAQQVYNRVAHVRLDPVDGPRIAFQLGEAADQYTISIDPTNTAWRRLGIRYVMLPSQPTDSSLQLAPYVIHEYRW